MRTVGAHGSLGSQHPLLQSIWHSWPLKVPHSVVQICVELGIKVNLCRKENWMLPIAPIIFFRVIFWNKNPCDVKLTFLSMQLSIDRVVYHLLFCSGFFLYRKKVMFHVPLCGWLFPMLWFFKVCVCWCLRASFRSAAQLCCLVWTHHAFLMLSSL